MAIRIIREEGDEILKKKSREVEKIDDKILELIQDMIETMHKLDRIRSCSSTSRSFKKDSSYRFI